MNQLNQVVIEGNCVRDAMVQVSVNDTKVATICMATTRFHDGTGVKEVAFFDVEGWGDTLAEFMGRKCKKGKRVRIIGRMKENRWTDESGKTFSKLFVVAEHVEAAKFTK